MIQKHRTYLFKAGIAVSMFFFVICGRDEKPVRPAAELSFDPETFTPAPGWKNKTVLLEYFTGSECGSCLATSLAVDGLIRAFDSPYLAVLEYHVNIPAPDPMENRSSHLRRFFYGVYRAPMIFFDGEEKFRGGAFNDSLAYRYFNLYAEEIKSQLYDMPPLLFSTVSHVVDDSLVITEISLEGTTEHAGFFAVLVEKDVSYLGHSRIQSHKQVVREVQTFRPDSTGSAVTVFNINAVEKSGRKWLEDLERNLSPFSFREKKFTIDRHNLQVVVFAQDSLSRKVYGASVSEIFY